MLPFCFPLTLPIWARKTHKHTHTGSQYFFWWALDRSVLMFNYHTTFVAPNLAEQINLITLRSGTETVRRSAKGVAVLRVAG